MVAFSLLAVVMVLSLGEHTLKFSFSHVQSKDVRSKDVQSRAVR